MANALILAIARLGVFSYNLPAWSKRAFIPSKPNFQNQQHWTGSTIALKREEYRMLLPILLALASAASVPQAKNTAPATLEQYSIAQNNQTWDRIYLGTHCPEGVACQRACASIRAYVFSHDDGENPRLQYVTDCPGMKAPQTRHTHWNGPRGRDHAPALQRTVLSRP